MRSPRLLLLVACSMLVVGCGSDPDPVVEQPAPGPAPVVPSPPDPSTPPRLSVRFADSKEAKEATVLFHDQEGNTIESVVPNADGIAFSRKGIATQATVYRGTSSLFTYTALEAGDEIVIAPSARAEATGFVAGTLPSFS